MKLLRYEEEERRAKSKERRAKEYRLEPVTRNPKLVTLWKNVKCRILIEKYRVNI